MKRYVSKQKRRKERKENDLTTSFTSQTLVLGFLWHRNMKPNENSQKEATSA